MCNSTGYTAFSRRVATSLVSIWHGTKPAVSCNGSQQVLLLLHADVTGGVASLLLFWLRLVGPQ